MKYRTREMAKRWARRVGLLLLALYFAFLIAYAIKQHAEATKCEARPNMAYVRTLTAYKCVRIIVEE